MRTAFARLPVLALLGCLIATAPALGQSTTGTIQGTITDNQGGVVPGATVTVRNVETNVSRAVATDADGIYRFLNMPVGNYELTVELSGFSRYVRSGLTLSLNQTAVVDAQIRPAAVTELVEVTADAPLLNTRNAEVGVRFDTTRVSELPVLGSRNIFTLARSAPGVSELGSGQQGFASGTIDANYVSNGARLRSNNFIIDGQDSNDPSVTGRQQAINNTDIVQEVRLITNQFAAEFGRAAGSIFSVVTKSGTNEFHGSGFWFHNDNTMNSRSNLDKAAGRASAPFRVENQAGGTVGGPVNRGSTFFFGSYQRWTDRRLGTGFTLTGAPTDAGRAVLQSVAAGRPHVQALLDHLPAGTANGRSASFTLGGQTFTVPLGNLTGSGSQMLNNNQGSARLDHQLTQNHQLVGRYIFSDTSTDNTGQVQVTPPGLTSNSPANNHSLNIWTNSVFGSNTSNEARVAWSHLGTVTGPDNEKSLQIPSIEINELGMIGFNAASNRTAIGLAVNLPQYRYNDTYQIQDNITMVRGNHLFKAGFDLRNQGVKSFFFPTIRGLLRYTSLNTFVNDTAEAANINKPLPGGSEINYYEWWDQYYFAQDDWRLGDNLTLNIGLRYEVPGNNIQSLIDLNQDILSVNNNNRVFALNPVPKTDKDNFEPRLGFNWSPDTSNAGGALGLLMGREGFVVRGGYARTHDYAFLNLALNIASSFPYVAAINRSNLPNAFAQLQSTPAGVPAGTDPNQLTRTVVADDFGSPAYDQFSLGVERQLSQNLALRVGYVGTFGNDLFQTLDGNPRQPFGGPNGPRVDPTRGVIRLRANTAESWYHSIQSQLDKRFSNGLTAGLHYTWSRFEDTASEVFNPSSGEIAVPQDSFNIAADKGRSAYDRPQRLTGNFVWELPWMRAQQGAAAKILGGWQVSSFFTFQSGAPFTVLNGADPTGALAGIDGLVGNAIRPNMNTDLDVSSMTVQELIAAGGARLFRPLCGMPSATCAGERVGNVPRNALRADGIGNMDVGIMKNTRFANGQNIQIRIEMFNATNTRNFGIPDGRINSANFLNQWATDGGRRRVWGAIRYTF
jgi:hypothetical protein